MLSASERSRCLDGFQALPSKFRKTGAANAVYQNRQYPYESAARLWAKGMINMHKLKFIAASAATLVMLAGPTLAEDLVFQLKNGTGSVLTRFYTSPVGVEQWEDDVFGEQVLNPNETIEITIGDGRDVCNYDMRFEFSEESDLDTTTDTQNLCELGTYTIHE